MNQKLFCVFAFILLMFTSSYADEKYINVQAYGKGPDRKTAMENALEEALRRNVGTMIMSREELNDDVMTEKVIQVSRGSIRDAEILSEENQNGEFILYVRFEIDSHRINEAVTNLREASNGETVDVKRRIFIEHGRNKISAFFRKLNLSEFINAETEDRKIDFDKSELSITIRITFNREKYLRDFAKPLNDIFDELLRNPEIDSEDDTVIYLLENERTFKAWKLPRPFFEAMKEGAGLDDFDSNHILKTHKRLWVNLMLLDSESHELSAERIPVCFPVTNIIFFSVRSDPSVWSLTGSTITESAIVCAPFFGEFDSRKNFYTRTFSDETDPLVKRFVFHLPVDTLSKINSVISSLNPE